VDEDSGGKRPWSVGNVEIEQDGLAAGTRIFDIFLVEGSAGSQGRAGSSEN